MTKPTVTGAPGAVAVDAAGILADLRELIHSARRRVATVANTEQTLLYWRLGKRIATENLIEGRSEYGKQILATVSQELMAEFGRGFTYTAIVRMVQFYRHSPMSRLWRRCRHNWAGAISLKFFLYPPLPASSTPRCAGWNAGRFAPCGRKSKKISGNGPSFS